MIKKFFEKRSIILFIGVLSVCICGLVAFISLTNFMYRMPLDTSYAHLDNNIVFTSRNILALVYAWANLYIGIIMEIISAVILTVGYFWKNKVSIIIGIVFFVLVTLCATATVFGYIINSCDSNWFIDFLKTIFYTVGLCIPTALLIVGYLHQNKIDKIYSKKKTK